MIVFFKNWFHKYFSQEEAVVLFLVLLLAFFTVVFLGHILAPVFASIVIAYLMQGPVSWMVARNVPKLIAVYVIYVLFLGAFFSLLFFLLPATANQLAELFDDLPRVITKAQVAIMLLPERYPELFSEAQVNEMMNAARQELTRLGQWAFSFSLSSLPNIFSAFIYLILVPILVFFFLKDGDLFIRWWVDVLPHERNAINKVWDEVNMQIANYVRGKAMEILIVGVVTYIVFMSLGVKYTALLATLIGLSVIVPYIGAAIVTVPVVLVGYSQWGWSSEFLYFMGAYAIIQALDGNVLVPVMFSEVVNLHPVLIVMAVLIFGGVWGIWGVFFAIPLATLLKAVFSAWPKASTTVA